MLLNNFEALCRSMPDAPAVVAGARQLTYGALDQQSSRLAGFLLHEAAVSRGALVAVYLPRTVDVLAGMLGAMKSGAAYTVVEQDGAEAERQHRLQAVMPAAVLCDAEQVAPLRLLGLRAYDCAAALAWTGHAVLPTLAPADVAYVLFTSGSTGTPKGVAVTHGNVAHYTGAIAARLGIDAPLRYAHISTLSADLGNTSLFLALATGGCLHLLDSALRHDPAAMRDYLITHAIAFLKITPSHWNATFSSMTQAHIDCLNLDYLVLGGEALPVALARRILETGGARVLSPHYGPTETTVGVTAYPLTSVAQLDTIKTAAVPIGQPLGATILRVRTDSGEFHDRNATGELYIGGPQVSAGYVNDPDTTASSFVALGSAGRFYKSGDHVTIDADGVVQFHGRIDRQVKANGYRIELGHVESVLRNVDGVDDAAVFFPEINGKRFLAAAVATQHTAPGCDWLRPRLADLMPEHMFPRRFVRMAAFPRTPNGKTDLKTLESQVVEQLRPRQRVPEAPAQPGMLDALRAKWRTCLRDAAFGDDDNFFDLGGDSLDAIELIAQLQVEGH